MKRKFKELLELALKFLFNIKNSPYDSVSLLPYDLEIKIIDKAYAAKKSMLNYSFIMPVLNEEANIHEILDSIKNQSLKPDEVIIVDGGSKDNTVKLINEFAKKNPDLNIQLHTNKVKRNIGAQRNFAIKHAKNECLMNIDAGTTLSKNYAATMMGSMMEYDADFVGGVHSPKVRYWYSNSFSRKVQFVSKIEPPGNAMLYKKSIATKIGYFPEYTSYAGEDTFFSYKYKKASKMMVLNRHASIIWAHPTNIYQAIRKKYLYAKGNFEIGMWPYYYYNRIHSWAIGFALKIPPLSIWFRGYLKNQANLEIEKRKIKGLFFVFGQNHINHPNSIELEQLTTRISQDNYKVFYINHIPKKADKDNKYFMDIDHSLLELWYHKHFSLKKIYKRYGDFMKDATIVIEKKDLAEEGLLARIKKYCPNAEIVYADN